MFSLCISLAGIHKYTPVAAGQLKRPRACLFACLFGESRVVAHGHEPATEQPVDKR